MVIFRNAEFFQNTRQFLLALQERAANLLPNSVFVSAVAPEGLEHALDFLVGGAGGLVGGTRIRVGALHRGLAQVVELAEGVAGAIAEFMVGPLIEAPKIVGKPLQLGGATRTVAGVMPRGCVTGAAGFSPAPGCYFTGPRWFVGDNETKDHPNAGNAGTSGGK